MPSEQPSNISSILEQLRPLFEQAIIGLPIEETRLYTLNPEKINEALETAKQYEGQEGYVNLLEGLSTQLGEVVTKFLKQISTVGLARGIDAKAWIGLTRAHLEALYKVQDELIREIGKYGNTDMAEAEQARLFNEQMSAYTDLYKAELEVLLAIHPEGDASELDVESIYLWGISLLSNAAATDWAMLKEEKLATASNMIAEARVKLQELKAEAQSKPNAEVATTRLDRIDKRLEQLYNMYLSTPDANLEEPLAA